MIFGKKLFRPLTPDEKRDREAREKRALEAIKEAQGAAKVCLESELFKDYMQKLLRGREAMVELILAIDEPTMEQEWKRFKELQIQLNQLEYLLREIEKDLEVEKIKKS